MLYTELSKLNSFSPDSKSASTFSFGSCPHSKSFTSSIDSFFSGKLNPSSTNSSSFFSSIGKVNSSFISIYTSSFLTISFDS
jgi:hypothetical protein